MINIFFKSSIGKKMLMAVTGIILFSFVVVHMLGNLQIFLGQDALNDYAAKLQKIPFLLWPFRLVLLGTLVVHVWVAVVLALENKKARGQRYAVKKNVQASYASRTMMMSGILVFLFTVYHLLHYTFGVTNPEVFHLIDAKGRYDIYSMVVLSYQNIYISGTYILAMVPLALHMSHGVSSLFQSLGLNHARFQPLLTWFAKGVALIIFIGNSSIPTAVLTGHLVLPKGGG